MTFLGKGGSNYNARYGGQDLDFRPDTGPAAVRGGYVEYAQGGVNIIIRYHALRVES